MNLLAQATDTNINTPTDWNWPLIGLIALAVIALLIGIAAFARRRDTLNRPGRGVAGDLGRRGIPGEPSITTRSEEESRGTLPPRDRF